MKLLNNLNDENQDFLQMFSGFIDRELKCKNCGFTANKLTDRLPILNITLLNYFYEQNMSNMFYQTTQKHKCDQCKTHIFHDCKAKLKKAPEVLIIRINSISLDDMKTVKSGLIKRLVFHLEKEGFPKKKIRYTFHCGVFVYHEDNESSIIPKYKMKKYGDYISISEENSWCVNMKNFEYYPKILFYIKENEIND